MGVEDPFARLYHYHFCHVHPETYESFDHYHPEDELLRVVRAVVPTAWVMHRGGPWLHARPPGAKLPQQGWKIHVSVLLWDHNGFWLFYRRLERGRFQWPADASSAPLRLTRRELRWLLDGLSLQQHQAHPEVTARTVI